MGVITIFYVVHGCIIIIMSKKKHTYIVSIVKIPQWIYPTFAKILLTAMRRGSMGFMQAFLLHVHVFVQGCLYQWEVYSFTHIQLQRGDVSSRAHKLGIPNLVIRYVGYNVHIVSQYDISYHNLYDMLGTYVHCDTIGTLHIDADTNFLVFHI